MEKSRKKKKSTKNTASNTSQSSGYSFEENFSAEELKQITLIANAIVKAEEIRKQKEEEDRKVYVDELYNSAGYKYHKNIIIQLGNTLKTYSKMPLKYINMLLSENSTEPIKKDVVSIAVLKFFVATLFGLVASFLLVVSVCSFLSIINQNTFLEIWTFLWFAIFTFVFSFMFGVMTLEILNSDDRNYIFSMSSLALSIISIIIAIIALVRGS